MSVVNLHSPSDEYKFIILLNMSANLKLFLRNAVIILMVINILNFILHISGMYGNFSSNRRPYIAPALDPNYSTLIINTSACQISNLRPDTKLYKYFVDVKPIECIDKRPALFTSNYTSIYMIESALKAYGFTNTSSVKCCYLWLKRKPFELGMKISDETALYQNQCISFNHTVNIPYEYIKMFCFKVSEYPKENLADYHNQLQKKSFYIDFFYFVKPCPIVQVKENMKCQRKVNVLIIGIDSMSRVNFQRQMPKTFQKLKSLGAIEFLGYHKVGENTFQNVIPMFSGSPFQEFLYSCAESKYFDACKLIWQNYKAQGYVTAFTEDAVNTGMFHYLNFKGFLKQPTDYYWHTFYKEADRAFGNQKINLVNYCFGSRKIHEILLEYLERFVTVMEHNKQPYFGHFWQRILTHNDFNQAQNGDQIYEELVSSLHEKGYLNNTVLFFMSDHGNRIGSFRRTYAGMIEDRLPLLFVKLPDWMTEQYPGFMQSLETNSKRLVTTYDIYETLMQLSKVNYSNLSEKIEVNVGIQPGCSLLAPITENRNCEMANIPNQWCLCQTSPTLQAKDDEIIINIANLMVSYINDKILSGFNDCVKLVFDSILYVRKSNTNNSSSSENSVGVHYDDYTVAFKTLPGKSLYEGTVRRTTLDGEMHSLVLSGAIIRINTYNNESLCVTDKIAQMYCFCSYLLKPTM